MAAKPVNASLVDQQTDASLTSARIVLPLLFQHYKPRSVVDVGCGVGSWLQCALDLGVDEVLGIGRDPVDASRLRIASGLFRVLDLNDRIEVGRKFDLAIAIQLAEHLSLHRSETFVADLVKLSDVVLFSAALPYQGGAEHINEQWLEFWGILFRRHGYVACDILRPKLWANEQVDHRCSQNLVVFCTKAHAAKTFPKEAIAADRPLSFPHPLTFLANVARYRPYSAEVSGLELLDYTNLLSAYLTGETTIPLLKTLTATLSTTEPELTLFPNARTEILDARAELRLRDSKIEDLSEELALRETETRNVVAELATQNETAGRLAAQAASRAEEIERLSSRNSALEIEVKELTSRLLAERAGLLQELETIKRELAQSDTALAAHRAEISRLSQKLVAEERERQALRHLADRQRSTLDAKFKQLYSMKEAQSQEVAKNEDQTRRLSSDLAAARHDLNATKASWSWKITAPIRGTLDIILWIVNLPRTIPQRLSQIRAYVQYLWGGSRLKASGLFDNGYYLAENPDVAKTKSAANALFHFFLFGAAENRNPNALFDIKYYLENNPDVGKSRINPLLHYLCWGAAEGRDPHPHFDTSFYLDRYPDTRAAGWNPLAHYLAPGISEGLDPNPWFDSSEYLEQNPEVALKGLNPLVHRLAGRALRRAPVPEVRVAESLPNELRSPLRWALQDSGRPLPDSEYDSYPLVSVIIPCFNQGSYLEDAVLSSLLSCSYPMEIIVVDDGSTDEASIAAVRELAANYRFKLVQQANKGLAGARNTGLRLARGKFIQFLDADDLLSPKKIDIQVDEFYGKPEIDICVSEYDLCNGAGSGRCRMQPSTIAGFALSREDFLLRWERGLSIPIHCALFRRKLLGDIEFRSVTQAGKEDWIFWIELTSQSPKFHFNPTPLATYRIHGQNTTTDHESMGLDFLRATVYVSESGLNTCENFWQASIEHFRSAYLWSIKDDAIKWSQAHPVD